MAISGYSSKALLQCTASSVQLADHNLYYRYKGTVELNANQSGISTENTKKRSHHLQHYAILCISKYFHFFSSHNAEGRTWALTDNCRSDPAWEWLYSSDCTSGRNYTPLNHIEHNDYYNQLIQFHTMFLHLY